MTQKPKAYSVLDKDENTGGIVFATRREQAIRRATTRYFDGEERETSCSRAAWADHHAESPIPAGEMVAHGWRFECSGCSRIIDDDMADLEHEGDSGDAAMYAGWTTDAVVGTQDSAIYCTPACQENDRREREIDTRRTTRAIARFTRILLSRLPDAQLVDTGEYGNRAYAAFDDRTGVPLLRTVSIPFTYPGARYGHATMEYSPRDRGSDRAIVYAHPGGDTDAFQAYLSSHQRTATSSR